MESKSNNKLNKGSQMGQAEPKKYLKKTILVVEQDLP